MHPFLCSEAAFSSRQARVLWLNKPENGKQNNNEKKNKKNWESGGFPSCAALGEAVLWVADFDGAPVAGSDQADEAQQVGKGPRHIGGVVTTRESPSTNLMAVERNVFIGIHCIFHPQINNI